MADEAVHGGQQGVEPGPVPAVRLPALQHEGVQRRGAVERSGEAVLVGHRLHHLQGRWKTFTVIERDREKKIKKKREEKRRKRSQCPESLECLEEHQVFI